MTPEQEYSLARERLDLEKRKFDAESRFTVRNSGALISASVSLAAIVISIVQIYISNESISESKSVENAIHLDEVQKKWDIEIAEFIFQHKDMITKSPDSRRELSQTIQVAFPPGRADDLLGRLEKVDVENTKTWADARSQISLFEVEIAGSWRCSQGCSDSTSLASISRSGFQLVLKNERGNESSGIIVDKMTIMAYGWGNLVGRISEDGNSIFWDNGTVWKKVS